MVIKCKSLKNKVITRGQKRQSKSNALKELGLELEVYFTEGEGRYSWMIPT